MYVALTRGPATVADIAENTELSTRQVRYALPKLIQRGLVEQKHVRDAAVWCTARWRSRVPRPTPLGNT